ncbi:hypothetical protein [Hymenobacter sp. PAMC 26628]|uniref:hypothetical protein n=1 Tax=Hymenobacter sp. PAMC 26628 TaxID=1484118 RepID=UPI0012FF88F8|nr:hypothetical protein [Hymenobacter sp. PAMC 26628]
MLATSFLLVFANVFVGQCWCATVNPVATVPHVGAPTHHEPAERPAHPGCHGHGAQAEHHGKHKGHSSNSATSHDCCKDKSASLLSSLTSPVQKQFPIPAPALLPAAIGFHFLSQAGQWDRTQAVTLVPPRQLKPKIPDIRIFIQSLTV